MSARLLHLPLPAAAEPTSPWGAPPEPGSNRGPALVPPADSPLLPEPPPLPPASLREARSLRDALTGLLSRERAAAADFLVALADFDQRRGWAALGHRSLFAFLSCELHLSDGAAFVRIAAARLLPQFPAVEAALRDGRLCLSTAGSVASVLKPENQAEWLPLFFGLSARQAKELAATLVPRADPPRREVLARIEGRPLRTSEVDRPTGGAGAPLATLETAALRTSEVGPVPATPTSTSTPTPAPTPTPAATPAVADLPLPSGERAGVRGPASPTPLSTIEPLSADLHRLHLTVSGRLVKKLASARDGLAHALPGATTEQVLEAALDLLLEKQARRKGLVKRPRTAVGSAGGAAGGAVAGENAGGAGSAAGGAVVSENPGGVGSAAGGAKTGAWGGAAASALPGVEATAPADAAAVGTGDSTAAGEPTARPPLGSPAARPRYVPAAVRREVWLRDGQRCQHPLDSGGTCGAITRLELDHVVPVALGGPSTAANLRVACAFHNRAAARAILGEALVEDQRARAQARRTR